MSALQDELYNQCAIGGLLPGLRTEYRFAAEATGGTGPGVRERLRSVGLRDWKFDFAWPKRRVAAEVDGGTWARKGAHKCLVCGQIPQGRHVRGKGFEGDCEKTNAAAAMGWKVFRYTAAMVHDGRAFAQLSDVLLPF